MTLKLTLVYSSAARQVREIALELPVGSTLAQALEWARQQWGSAHPQHTHGCKGSSQAGDWPAAAVAAAEFGLWGRAAAPQTVLHDGDRIEIYRPLRVDPKVARRERYRQRNTKPSAGPNTA